MWTHYNMTEEQKILADSLINKLDKKSTRELSKLYTEITGIKIVDCFCSGGSRKRFHNLFKTTFE